MNTTNNIWSILWPHGFMVLYAIKVLTSILLERLNLRWAQKKSLESDAKSLAYTSDKTRLSIIDEILEFAMLAFLVYFGIIPLILNAFPNGAVWQALGLIVVMFVAGLPSIPMSYYGQFVIEAKHGFNKSTPALWVSDQLKGMALGLLISWPLLILLMWLVGHLPYWWVWGFMAMMVFQATLLVLYPLLIMPLFNKFSPLPEGSLKNRLFALAEKCQFPTSKIEVMDGSKRSGHSNAFFIGFGKARKIVFFDTLLEQLTEDELEAVLAHEIGHYKKGHVPRRLLLSTVILFFTFLFIDYLISSFGLGEKLSWGPNALAAVLLFLGFFGGVFTFWLSPISAWKSRKDEYEADAYAVVNTGGYQHLAAGLKKLQEKNLSNPNPHPIYVGFYYSHPPVESRITAMKSVAIN